MSTQNMPVILEEVLLKMPEVTSEIKAKLLKEADGVLATGQNIYETLKQLHTPEEQAMYLGAVVEGLRIRAHLSYLASYPKAVSPLHERRAHH